MAPQEKAQSEVVDHLERGRQDFLDAVAGLEESQAKVRPDPARWSVLDCVEHVTFVEARFLGWLENAKRVDAPQVDKAKEAGVLAGLADRSRRLQAPDAVRPAGRYATLAQAIEQFNANRTRSVQFAQDHQDELYYMALEHPRLGPMNGVEFMMIVAGHAGRHAAQIRETRSALEKN